MVVFFWVTEMILGRSWFYHQSPQHYCKERRSRQTYADTVFLCRYGVLLGRKRGLERERRKEGRLSSDLVTYTGAETGTGTGAEKRLSLVVGMGKSLVARWNWMS